MQRSSRVVYDVIRDCPYEGASSHVIPVAYGRISNAHPSRGWGRWGPMGRGVGSDFFTPPHGVGTPSLAPHGVGAPWVPHRPTPPRRSLLPILIIVILNIILYYLDFLIL